MTERGDSTMIRSLSKTSVRLAVKSTEWNPSQSEWMLAGQCVQPEEKDRIGRFVFKKDSRSAMIGRLLIRAASAHILDIPYEDIKLGRTDKSKPIILNNLQSDFQHFNFNISHQGQYVVLAAEKFRQVGIDVMDSESTRDSISKFFSLMKRHLTEFEWKTVASQSTERQQLRLFYRHWCLKESVVKAIGIGIGYEIGKLEFNMPTIPLSTNEVARDTSVTIEGKFDPDWSFEETMLEDHCIAVAIKNPSNKDQSKTQSNGAGQLFHIISVPDVLQSCVPLPGASPDLEYWKAYTKKSEQPVKFS